jgi:hypothetical protein
MRFLPSVARVGLVLALVSVASVAAAQPAPDPDLIKMGQSVLPDDSPAPGAKPKPKPKPAAKPGASAAASAGAVAAVPAGPAGPAGGAAAAADASVDAAPDASSDAGQEADASSTGLGGPSANAAADGGGVDAGAPRAATAPAKEEPKPPRAAPGGVGPAARKARIESGENLPMTAAAESPLAKVGVPAAAVPAVATVATVGAMAFWPFLVKTVAGLLKGLLAAFLKTRAKKGVKVDKTLKTLNVMGFVVRPAELGALLLGALIYGLGVCYAFQGRKMSASFLVSQEALVVVIYYSRSFVRFAYERMFKLTTQYKFWLGGGMLCLASAYLGNTLGTVGYELEEAGSPEDADRIAKMKAWLIVISLGMALVFCAANIASPAKILQSGRVMMSGMALAEILPITPMPGKKIFAWKPVVWVLLVVLVVPAFIAMNFIL